MVHAQVLSPIWVSLTLVLLSTAPASAELDDGDFVSETWRVKMSVPSNWQATEQTAYPNVLLWMERREPQGVMLLSAEPVPDNLSPLDYAKKTLVLLKKMGFVTRPPQLHSSTGATLIDFQSENTFLRQAFLVVGGFGYTLTLSANNSRIRGFHLRAFDDALRSITPLRTTRSNSNHSQP